MAVCEHRQGQKKVVSLTSQEMAFQTLPSDNFGRAERALHIDTLISKWIWHAGEDSSPSRQSQRA